MTKQKYFQIPIASVRKVTSFIVGTQFVILDVLTFTFPVAKPVIVCKLSVSNVLHYVYAPLAEGRL
jgi:hypothetical protein